MLNGNDWIITKITDAKKDHDLLTSFVLTRMDDLLRRQLSHRPLSNTELTAVAKQLITGMIPPSPETEATQ